MAFLDSSNFHTVLTPSFPMYSRIYLVGDSCISNRKRIHEAI